MTVQKLLPIFPDRHESDPAIEAVVPPTHRDPEHIERVAADVAGVALARTAYEGRLENEHDLLGLYLTEAARHPLLSADEEKAYAHQMRKGKRAEVEAIAEEYIEFTEHQAELAIADGLVARSIMISANLRWVLKISGRSSVNNRGLSRLELVQEGNIGLIKALEKFDPDKGFRLTTFATSYIKGEMAKGIAKQGSPIRVPAQRREEIDNVRNATAELRHRLGREPTTDEVADEVEVTPARIAEIRQDAITMQTDSLTATKRSTGEEYEQDAILDDDSAQVPFEKVLRTLTVDQSLEALLSGLDGRQREYLSWRFGLYDGNSRTQEQVGELMGFTRQRSEQIEKKTLEKLRSLAVGRISSEDIA